MSYSFSGWVRMSTWVFCSHASFAYLCVFIFSYHRFIEKCMNFKLRHHHRPSSQVMISMLRARDIISILHVMCEHLDCKVFTKEQSEGSCHSLVILVILLLGASWRLKHDVSVDWDIILCEVCNINICALCCDVVFHSGHPPMCMNKCRMVFVGFAFSLYLWGEIYFRRVYSEKLLMTHLRW